MKKIKIIITSYLIALIFIGCSTIFSRNPKANDSKIKQTESAQSKSEITLAQKVDMSPEARLAWRKEQKVAKAKNSQNPNYKQRYPDKAWDWFYSRRIDFNTKRIPVDYREKALKDTKERCLPKLAKDVQANWTSIGPFPHRGRIKDICVNPQNDSIIFVASASGGVFKTDDMGQNWICLTDNKIPTLGIGSLIMDPNDPNTLYAGLGEGLYGVLYEPLGSGIYKTSDGGNTWTLNPGSANNAMQVTVDLQYGENSQILYAACLGVNNGSDYGGKGFFKTIDGGQTWVQKKNARCWSVSVDPSNKQSLLLSTDETNGAKIYYSADGGNTLNTATTPSDANAKRIELARSKSNPQIVYALVGAKSSGLSGIWKSTNGGQTWSLAGTTGIPVSDANEKPGQMLYNNCIAVSPTDPNTVYIGTNLRAYKTTDGANNWTSLSYWWVPNNFSLPYVHADHHGISFGSNSNTVFYATDGGFHVSFDGGTTWEERNNGLLCTQIYRNSCSKDIANQNIIGCQDNSAYVQKSDGTYAYIPWFGDGFENIVDQQNNNYVYLTGYYGNNILFSHKKGDNPESWYYLRDRDGNNGIPKDEQGGWVIPLIADPLDPSTLYVGLVNLYKTKMQYVAPTADPGMPTWTKIITLADQVYQMEVVRLSYGPQDRKIFFFQSRYNQTNGWGVSLARYNIDGTGATQLNMPRLGFVNEIACDPNNNNNVWIAYSDIGNYPQEVSRIYKSSNLGASWTDKTNNLPKSLPISAIFIDPQNSNTIIIGTDLGCYRSDNDGDTWYLFSNGLPNTVITDIAYFPADRKIRAATYGRGLWETSIDGQAGKPDIKVEPNNIIFQ